MSGLCDAHTHFSWNNSADLDGLGTMPVEEHLLFAVESAKKYIDSGYTMCLGAASAKERLDVVCRDAINAGRIPGPRYLANGPEIAVTGGALIKSITKFADGPEGMRKAVRELDRPRRRPDQAVDDRRGDHRHPARRGHLLLRRGGGRRRHRGPPPRQAGLRPRPFRGEREDVRAEQGRHRLPRLLHRRRGHGHARGRTRTGCSSRPGINWLVATLYEAEAFGFPQEAAEAVGYKKELEQSPSRVCARCTGAGSSSLPGGDYGFAWTPHGTYARDLEHFVERLGFTPMEAILSATKLGGEIMLRPDELGQVQPGFLADLILVDGDPLADITVLQDHDRHPGDHEGRRVPQAGRTADDEQRPRRPRRSGHREDQGVRRGPPLSRRRGGERLSGGVRGAPGRRRRPR